MLEFPPDQNDQLHSHDSTSSLPEVDLKKKFAKTMEFSCFYLISEKSTRTHSQIWVQNIFPQTLTQETEEPGPTSQQIPKL